MKDAGDFAEVMKAQEGRQYARVVTRVLTDAQATRQSVLAGLQWLSVSVGPQDVGFLFLAGHGVSVHAGQYYFLTYESRHEQVQQTALAERDIRLALRRIRGRALFFVDTCFAGNVIGDPKSAGRELARMANELSSADSGVVVFASSSGRQESVENDAWGNGAFTRALIDGLRESGSSEPKGADYFQGP